MRLFRIILIALFGLCLTMKVQGAEAHSFAAPAHPASYTSSSPAKPGTIVVVALASQDNEDGCKDGCCTSTMSCCVAALPPTAEMQLRLEAAGIVALSNAPLPQGPPFTLLRPPRAAA